MDELELPLTPLEQSRADFGQRFYKIKVGFHNGLFTALNAANGRASGVGTRAVTLREIPLEDDMTLNQDGTHYLLAYPIQGRDDQYFEDIFNSRNPDVAEITKATYDLEKPNPETL
jgi:hypothetical protein